MALRLRLRSRSTFRIRLRLRHALLAMGRPLHGTPLRILVFLLLLLLLLLGPLGPDLLDALVNEHGVCERVLSRGDGLDFWLRRFRCQESVLDNA